MSEEESKETYYADNRIKALRIRAGLDQQSTVVRQKQRSVILKTA